MEKQCSHIIKYLQRRRSLLLYVTGAFDEACVAESVLILANDEIRQIKGEFDRVVFDLSGCIGFDYTFVRPIMRLNAQLKSEDKSIRIACPSKEFSRFLIENGLTTVLPIAEIQEEVSTRRIDVKFVNPFIDSALETLKIQCAMLATAGKPFLQTPTYQEISDIVGLIELESASFNGAIALCFPEQTFLALMSGMLGEQCVAINPDLEDGAGELLNIIFGQVRLRLAEQQYEVSRAIPSVVRGVPGVVRALTPEPSVIVPFKTDKGSFHIRIGIQ